MYNKLAAPYITNWQHHGSGLPYNISSSERVKARPGILSKTLSHMRGKFNLPIFLLNVGLFTLINIVSLMFLAKPFPSLPIIWKLCLLVGWPVLLK